MGSCIARAITRTKNKKENFVLLFCHRPQVAFLIQISKAAPLFGRSGACCAFGAICFPTGPGALAGPEAGRGTGYRVSAMWRCGIGMGMGMGMGGGCGLRRACAISSCVGAGGQGLKWAVRALHARWDSAAFCAMCVPACLKAPKRAPRLTNAHTRMPEFSFCLGSPPNL